MLPAFLIFAWLPLFFALFALFIFKARAESRQPARMDVEGRKRLWQSRSVRTLPIIAFGLPVLCAAAATGLYILLKLERPSLALGFVVTGVLMAIVLMSFARHLLVDLSFDEQVLCSKALVLPWKLLRACRFDSFSCCYILSTAASGTDAAQSLRVPIFAGGIGDFEAMAERCLDRQALDWASVERALRAGRARRS